MTKKKGKRPKIYVNVYSKSQRLSKQGEISNITLTMRGDCLKKGPKRSNVKIECGVKCKAPSYVIKFCERSYLHTSIIEMGHMI